MAFDDLGVKHGNAIILLDLVSELDGGELAVSEMAGELYHHAVVQKKHCLPFSGTSSEKSGEI